MNVINFVIPTIFEGIIMLPFLAIKLTLKQKISIRNTINVLIYQQIRPKNVIVLKDMIMMRLKLIVAAAAVQKCSRCN